MGPKVFDGGPTAADKAANAAEGFGETAAYQVDLVGHPKMIGRAPPVSPQNAQAMRIIHHDETIGRPRHLDQFRHRGNVPLH